MTVVARFAYLQRSNQRGALPVDWPLCRLWSKRVPTWAAMFRFLHFGMIFASRFVELGYLTSLLFSMFVFVITIEPLFLLGLAYFGLVK